MEQKKTIKKPETSITNARKEAKIINLLSDIFSYQQVHKERTKITPIIMRTN